MTYTIIDHGVWKGYTPNPLPEWAIEPTKLGMSFIFFRRESDGKDFYEWRDGGIFKENSIVAQTFNEGDPGGETVKGVFRDYTMLSPFNQRVIEILGVDPNEKKPHNLFAWMIYDPKTKTLSGEPTPPKAPEMPEVTFKKDLWIRTTEVEADKIEDWVATQPARDRRMFNETITIIHTDPLYDNLLKAFTELFGAERANILLASSIL